MALKRSAAQAVASEVKEQLLQRVVSPRFAVYCILKHLGYTDCKEDTFETPNRYVAALDEMTAGRHMNARKILSKTFKADYDEMVWLKGIQFTSLCEHHLLPFVGAVSIAYIPEGRVVGISKLARLVECFSKRLQIQERMTQEIALSVEQHLKPRGVGVIVKAHHCCMSCRGVKQSQTEMVTSCLRGVIKRERETRAEFLSNA